jgi:predicted Holliday junction resolvase-like endonuclease
MIEWLLIAGLLLCLLILVILYVRQTGAIESRAKELFSAWRTQEQEQVQRWKEAELEQLSSDKARILFDGWKNREEEEIRSDAVKRSHAVTRGKITEHLIPYFPDFPYNPKDARFLGSPVDLIVFDGLSEEEIRQIVFVEIKASRNPALSRREREVRTCIEEKRIGYRMLHQVPSENTLPGPGDDPHLS